MSVQELQVFGSIMTALGASAQLGLATYLTAQLLSSLISAGVACFIAVKVVSMFRLGVCNSPSIRMVHRLVSELNEGLNRADQVTVHYEPTEEDCAEVFRRTTRASTG